MSQLFDGLFKAISGLLAFFYSLFPSYGLAIVLLTLVVMLVLFPLNKKQTKSFAMMGRLNPELKKLQQLHKNDRQKLNEETMALYQRYGVNPLMGCVPLIVQMPVFFVLYNTILGLTHKVTIDGRKVPKPKHLAQSSDMYQDIVEGGGRLLSMGVDLAKSTREAIGDGVLQGLPFVLLIAAVVGTSYWQQHMISKRNPPAMADNPMAQQMQMMTKITPFFFGFISFNIQAGVVIYFLVSNLFRIGQQWVLFKTDPILRDKDAPLPVVVDTRSSVIDDDDVPPADGNGKPAGKVKPTKVPAAKPGRGPSSAPAQPPTPKASGRVTAPGTAARPSNKKKSKRGR